MAVKQVAILGSTGSIGVNTLDVIRAHPDRFKIVALTAAKQVDLLAEQCAEFRPGAYWRWLRSGEVSGL